MRARGGLEVSRGDAGAAAGRRLALAGALREAGRSADAAMAFETAARGTPSVVEASAAWLAAGGAWERSGEPQRALAAYDQAAHAPGGEASVRALVAAAGLNDAGGRVADAVVRLEAAVARGLPEDSGPDTARRLCELAWLLGDPARAAADCERAGQAVSGAAALRLRVRAAEGLLAAGRRDDATTMIADVLRRVRRRPAVAGRAHAVAARLAAARGEERAAKRAWNQVVLAASRVRGDAELAELAASALAGRALALSGRAGRIALVGDGPKAVQEALRARARLARDAVEAWRAVFGTGAERWAGRAALGEAEVYDALQRDMSEALRASPGLRALPPEPHAGPLDERIARYREEAWSGYGAALQREQTGPRAWEAAAALARLAPEKFPLARVTGLGSPWGESEAPPAFSADSGEVRREVWERPADPRAQLALAALEASEGRRALSEHALERAWALAGEGAELPAAWHLSAARLWAWLDAPGRAREALERAVAVDPRSPEAWAKLAAERLATLRYADAAEAFRAAAASAGAEPACPVLLGLSLTAVAVATGDPGAFPAAPLETYLARCEAPDPLALLWLARHRAAHAQASEATDLCRRYLTHPSPDDPTAGAAWCR